MCSHLDDIAADARIGYVLALRIGARFGSRFLLRGSSQYCAGRESHK